MHRSLKNVISVPTPHTLRACPMASDPPELILRYYMIARQLIWARRYLLQWPRPRWYGDDMVLRYYHFPNIFREDDPTTQHCAEWIKGAPYPVLNLLMYRAFNNSRLFSVLRPFEDSDSLAERERKVLELYARGQSPFGPGPKFLPLIPQRVTGIFRSIRNLMRSPEAMRLLDGPERHKDLESITWTLRRVMGVTDPLCYEVTTDLSYDLMADAPDKDTYVYAHTAARRGILLLRGLPVKRVTRMGADIAAQEVTRHRALIAAVLEEHYEGFKANEALAPIAEAFNPNRVTPYTAVRVLSGFAQYHSVLDLPIGNRSRRYKGHMHKGTGGAF